MLCSWSFQKKEVEEIAEGKRKHNHTNAILQSGPGQVENGKSWKEIQSVATRSELYMREWQMDTLYCCPREDWQSHVAYRKSIVTVISLSTTHTEQNDTTESNTKL